MRVPKLDLITITLNTGKHHWEGRPGDPDGPNAAEVAQALVVRRVSN